ncbi:MAG: hypothetical protein HZB99_01175 [Candidatus Harrisonbacteria bacterium]|nr:hypothetical protein [Candidatus Harrisonbacteria bacterium]
MTDFNRWLLKNIGVASGVILALVALTILLGNDISRRLDTVIRQRRDLVERSEVFNYLATLRFDSERAKKLSDQLQNSLPTKDQLIGFSKNLENLAKDNQLGFGFQFESEVLSTDLAPGINNFTITSNGSYSNFLRFLKAAESGQYFVNFTLLDLIQKGKEFEITMRGKVFSQ